MQVSSSNILNTYKDSKPLKLIQTSQNGSKFMQCYISVKKKYKIQKATRIVTGKCQHFNVSTISFFKQSISFLFVAS